MWLQHEIFILFSACRTSASYIRISAHRKAEYSIQFTAPTSASALISTSTLSSVDGYVLNRYTQSIPHPISSIVSHSIPCLLIPALPVRSYSSTSHKIPTQPTPQPPIPLHLTSYQPIPPNPSTCHHIRSHPMPSHSMPSRPFPSHHVTSRPMPCRSILSHIIPPGHMTSHPMLLSHPNNILSYPTPITCHLIPSHNK